MLKNSYTNFKSIFESGIKYVSNQQGLQGDFVEESVTVQADADNE